MMEAQDKQEDGIPTPEVMAVLLDLARLSHHTESATSETPGGIAIVLLERLLGLCAAQCGALFLTLHSSGVSAQKLSPSVSSSRKLRPLAIHDVNAIHYSPEGGAIDVIVRPVQALVPQDKQTASRRQAGIVVENTGADEVRTEVQPTAQKLQQMVEICMCDHGQGIPRVGACSHRSWPDPSRDHPRRDAGT
jgi:hypothetical protein